MLIEVITYCSQGVSVLILLRTRAMLIEVTARWSQSVSVSILIRARAILIKVIAGLSSGCECGYFPSTSSLQLIDETVNLLTGREFVDCMLRSSFSD
jgi:hypothetical protein